MPLLYILFSILSGDKGGNRGYVRCNEGNIGKQTLVDGVGGVIDNGWDNCYARGFT